MRLGKSFAYKEERASNTPTGKKNVALCKYVSNRCLVIKTKDMPAIKRPRKRRGRRKCKKRRTENGKAIDILRTLRQQRGGDWADDVGKCCIM